MLSSDQVCLVLPSTCLLPQADFQIAQISHLSRHLRGMDAFSLRFTVYARGEGDGRIIELLNTGMLRSGLFFAAQPDEAAVQGSSTSGTAGEIQQQGGQQQASSSGRVRMGIPHEVSLDFGEDVSFLFFSLSASYHDISDAHGVCEFLDSVFACFIVNMTFLMRTRLRGSWSFRFPREALPLPFVPGVSVAVTPSDTFDRCSCCLETAEVGLDANKK